MQSDFIYSVVQVTRGLPHVVLFQL